VPIPGADQAIAATAYEGISRQLVAALKFRGRLSVARPMAATIAAAVHLPPDAAVVPVPPAPSRQRRRGFDPADEIAAALSRVTGRPFLRCLKRAEGPRQVGRARRDRLAAPPRVWASGPVPLAALLVDDVVTTGATLGACGLALRAAGAIEVRAAAFARSVGRAPLLASRSTWRSARSGVACDLSGRREGGERADRGQGAAHPGDR
jgi:predicted amidophosphoribosyltransferase